MFLQPHLKLPKGYSEDIYHSYKLPHYRKLTSCNIVLNQINAIKQVGTLTPIKFTWFKLTLSIVTNAKMEYNKIMKMSKRYKLTELFLTVQK